MYQLWKIHLTTQRIHVSLLTNPTIWTKFNEVSEWRTDSGTDKAMQWSDVGPIKKFSWGGRWVFIRVYNHDCFLEMKWSVVQKTEWASVLSMCPTALLALYLYLPRTVFIITIGNYSPNPGNTMWRALLRGSPARSLGTLKPAWAPWGPQQIPAKQEIKIFSDPTKLWLLGPVDQHYAT